MFLEKFISDLFESKVDQKNLSKDFLIENKRTYFKFSKSKEQSNSEFEESENFTSKV